MWRGDPDTGRGVHRLEQIFRQVAQRVVEHRDGLRGERKPRVRITDDRTDGHDLLYRRFGVQSPPKMLGTLGKTVVLLAACRIAFVKKTLMEMAQVVRVLCTNLKGFLVRFA